MSAKRWQDSLPLLFLFVVFLGAFGGDEPFEALGFICLFGGYFLAERHPLSNGIFVYAGAVLGALAIFEKLGGFAPTLWVDETVFGDLGGRVVGTLGNPNILAFCLLVTLPFAYMFLEKGKYRRGLACLVLIYLGLYLTFCRGAWFALGLGLLFFLLFATKKPYRFIFLGLGVLPFLPQKLVLRATTIVGESSGSYRLAIWQSILEQPPLQLLTGLGTGRGVLGDAMMGADIGGLSRVEHTHSLYLGLVVRYGVLGLVFFALVILFLFATAFFMMRRGKKEGVALASLLLSFLFFGLFDDPFYAKRATLFFFLAIGTLVGKAGVLKVEKRNDEIITK